MSMFYTEHRKTGWHVIELTAPATYADLPKRRSVAKYPTREAAVKDCRTRNLAAQS